MVTAPVLLIIPVTAFSCVCRKGVENPLDFKQEWVWIVQVVC
jgi:hypothetical protein